MISAEFDLSAAVMNDLIDIFIDYLNRSFHKSFINGPLHRTNRLNLTRDNTIFFFQFHSYLSPLINKYFFKITGPCNINKLKL